MQEQAEPLFEVEEAHLSSLPLPEEVSSQELVGLQQASADELSFAAEEPLTDTLYIMDDSVGSYRVTGMFQNVQVDQDQAIDQLLERPRISFFDLSWSNW